MSSVRKNIEPIDVDCPLGDSLDRSQSPPRRKLITVPATDIQPLLGSPKRGKKADEFEDPVIDDDVEDDDEIPPLGVLDTDDEDEKENAPKEAGSHFVYKV